MVSIFPQFCDNYSGASWHHLPWPRYACEELFGTETEADIKEEDEGSSKRGLFPPQTPDGRARAIVLVSVGLLPSPTHTPSICSFGAVPVITFGSGAKMRKALIYSSFLPSPVRCAANNLPLSRVHIIWDCHNISLR